MTELITFERRDLLRWALAVLCCGWLFGATLHVINITKTEVPLDGANSYMPYERQLAACNELRTSQAKYDCTTRLMLGRDRSMFTKILIVLLPPLALIGTVGFIGFARRVRREREQQRAAREAYQTQMAAYRAKVAAEEAEIAAGVRKQEMFLDDDGNLVEPPAHLSRWREETP
jgi:hypothetical protein